MAVRPDVVHVIFFLLLLLQVFTALLTRSQVDEPGLCGETNPLTFGLIAREVEIMDDIEPRRIVHEAFVRLAQAWAITAGSVKLSAMVFRASSKSASFHCSKLKPFGEKLADEK